MPTESFIVLGFSGDSDFEGPGNDIFMSEVGGTDERTDVFVSSDLGATFTFLGQATTSAVTGFDFASIGFTGKVNAVKILGLDTSGGSPSFDLAFVEGLEGSVVVNPLPVQAALPLLSSGVAALAMVRRRKSRA